MADRETEGNFTVEAAFVMSLTLLAVLTAVLMSFYLRDLCTASARIRLESLEGSVAEVGAEPTPVFTLTEGRRSKGDGAGSVQIQMDGIWPLSLLYYAETVQREKADPVRLLRELRQEGLR